MFWRISYTFWLAHLGVNFIFEYLHEKLQKNKIILENLYCTCWWKTQRLNISWSYLFNLTDAGIKRMIVHEEFDYDTATNDICLLELQESTLIPLS